jgi:FADH2 O2-dependent halogenase
MRSYDVLILGSGFGGSLLSQILVGGGFKVALIDRARHPRFAIGESSTPLADATLARLADRYHLSALRPLTQYGNGPTRVCCVAESGASRIFVSCRAGT